MSIPFLSNLDLNQNELQNARIQNLASDPISPVEGQIWLNTTSHRLKGYQNSVVVTYAILADSLNAFASPTADLSINNHKLTNVSDPTVATDAATKGYVDAVAIGLDVKASCRVATDGALPAYTYANGSSGVGATITASVGGPLTVDGVLVIAGDRILVKNGAAASDNGIYVVTDPGSSSGPTPFVLTRATDCDHAANYPTGAFTLIEQGTNLAGFSFVVSTQGSPFTIGSTSITWVKFSAAAGTVNKYSTTLSSGSATYTVTHSLGTTDVHVQVYESTGSLRQIDVEIQIIDANSVSILFAVATAANYRAVVIG